jgi:RNA polymerase sigma-B factor
VTSAPTESDLFARRDQPDARRELVERYDYLAQRLARRFLGRGIALDDLVQVARFGLMNAIDRFDVDYGTRFSTFAGRTIIGEIKHHFRNKAWSIRVPRSLQNLWLATTDAVEELSQRLGRSPRIAEIAEHVDADPEEVLEAMDAGGGYTASSLDRPVGAERRVPLLDLLGDTDSRLDRSAEWSDTAAAIERLEPRERSILYMRFYEGKTQREIGNEIGVSQVHVSRLLRQTLDELRAHVEGDEN